MESDPHPFTPMTTTKTTSTRSRSMLHSFIQHARTQGQSAALLWRGRTTTYEVLADMAVQAHAAIVNLDLERGEAIAIVGKKSPAAIATVMACMMARRPFLLPSADLGDVALASLLAIARCRHVLAPDKLDIVEDCTSTFAATALLGFPIFDANATSFMLTTSGSTGSPKVVPLSVGAVDAFTDWAGDAFPLGPGSVVLNYAPLNFDLCLLDIWATLKHGGCVALVDQDQAMNARWLFDLFATAKPTVVQAVPSLFRLLLDARSSEAAIPLASVEHAMVTGEAIAPNVLARLPELLPNARLYNIYGCTETNDSFIHEIENVAEVDAGRPLPIGKALPGVHAMIMGDDGRALDAHDGAGSGELWVSTPFQTRGYLGSAASANERFVTRGSDEEMRAWYRSGDLVQRDANGCITLIGRNDFQVKVRGVRVNLEEIEQVLLEHEGISEAAVVAVVDPIAGGNQLRALVRCAPTETKPSSLELRAHCARRLPRPAIPSTIRIIEQPLPHTITNKIDRRRVKELFLIEQQRPTTDVRSAERSL